MKKNQCLLLDARAGLAGLCSVDITDATVFMVGTAKECCDAANSNEYGKGCVVADKSGIRWDWSTKAGWKPTDREVYNAKA